MTVLTTNQIANLRAYCVIIDRVAVDEFTPPAQALLLLDYVRTPAPRQAGTTDQPPIP